MSRRSPDSPKDTMSAAERLLAQLRDVAPSGVPSELQIPLAEKLRELAHDLELEARSTALPSSTKPSDGEIQSPENWETIATPSGSVQLSQSNASNPNSPLTNYATSSGTWETIRVMGVPLPSSSLYDANTPSTPANHEYRPFNPWDEQGQLHHDSICAFDDSPLALSPSPEFTNSPGPDRRMPLFAANHGPSAFHRSPIRLPSSPVPSLAGYKQSDLSAPEKKAWWEANDHLQQREASSPIERLTPKNNLPVDVSFSNRSEFEEGETDCFTPNNQSDRIEDERSSFLINGTGLGLDDPFWGKPPIRYPALDDPDDNLSTHNRFSAPVNRSHQLLLVLRAARRDEPESLPCPRHSQPPKETMLTAEAAKLPLPPSPTSIEFEDSKTKPIPNKGRPLSKPSKWNSMTHGVLNIGRRKEQSEPLGIEVQKDADGTASTVEEKLGWTGRVKKSLGIFFNASPRAKYRGR